MSTTFLLRASVNETADPLTHDVASKEKSATEVIADDAEALVIELAFERVSS